VSLASQTISYTRINALRRVLQALLPKERHALLVKPIALPVHLLIVPNVLGVIQDSTCIMTFVTKCVLMDTV
jgi:hypothetical protein